MQAKVMWLSSCKQYRVIFYDWYEGKKYRITSIDYFTPSKEDAIEIATETVFSDGWIE